MRRAGARASLDLALAAARRNLAFDPSARTFLVTAGMNAALAGQIACAEGVAVLGETADDAARDGADRLPPTPVSIGLCVAVADSSSDDAKRGPGGSDVSPRPDALPLILDLAGGDVRSVPAGALLSRLLLSGGRLHVPTLEQESRHV